MQPHTTPLGILDNVWMKTLSEHRSHKKFVTDLPITPIELLEKITNNIPLNKNFSIGVMFTIEWALYLKVMGFNNITVITDVADGLVIQWCKRFQFEYLALSECNLKECNFDVVVGNPPYAHKTLKKSKPWVSFLKTALEISKQYVAFITPDVWIDGYLKCGEKARKIISQYSLIRVDLNQEKFFNVAETMCSFVVKKQKDSSKTIFTGIDNVDEIEYYGQLISKTDDEKKSHDICKKLYSDNNAKKYLKRFIPVRPKSMENFSKIQDNKFMNKVYFSSKESFYTDFDTDAYKGHKIIFNNSGYYYQPSMPGKYIWKDYEGVAMVNAFQILFKNETEVDNALTFFTSELYRFFVESTKTGGFNATALYNLPILDLSKKWTDDEIYDFFKITEEEKLHVKSTLANKNTFKMKGGKNE